MIGVKKGGKYEKKKNQNKTNRPMMIETPMKKVRKITRSIIYDKCYIHNIITIYLSW